MKLILLSLAVVLLGSEVYGQGNWPPMAQGNWPLVAQGNWPPMPLMAGGWPPHGPIRRPHNLFPKCKDFMQEVHNQLRETGSGPFACRTAEDEDDCQYQELMKARQAITSAPSDGCRQQVMDFLNGVPPTGSNTSGGSGSQ